MTIEELSAAEQIKNSKSYIDLDEHVEAFRTLSAKQKKAAEPDLINLLKDNRKSEFERASASKFLGVIGSSKARQALMDRLPQEKSAIVRAQIATDLATYFTGDDRIELLVTQFDKERSLIGRRMFVRALTQSDSPSAVPKLVQLLDEEDEYVRHRIAKAMGQMQIHEAAEQLVKRLYEEDVGFVTKAMLNALVVIEDHDTVPTFLKMLDQSKSTDILIAILEGLGDLPKSDTTEVIDRLLETVCHESPVASITATNVLVKKLDRAKAARHIAELGLERTDPHDQKRIADALRVIGGTAATDYLAAQTDNPQAQTLLEQIGGSQAVNAVVQRRMEVANRTTERVAEFDGQALDIFNRTIHEAKRGFNASLWMSIVIFAVGVILITIGAIQASQASLPGKLYDAILGVITSATGLGTMLTMFYKGPTARIERAVANLVQVG